MWVTLMIKKYSIYETVFHKKYENEKKKNKQHYVSDVNDKEIFYLWNSFTCTHWENRGDEVSFYWTTYVSVTRLIVGTGEP